ncbi:pullulanase [Bifidobacterium italicum]|uniref:Pullulanase n=1 Tax=Bifidobacterium italicum TaxID=1960968 RepID=A0A2A2EL12_9BIFI|nr:type I pullulanase [Bifidobacterium italicum]PAU69620.1 pullulanase [Bifidobacterium italicum]
MIQAFEPLSEGLEPGVAEPFPLCPERTLGAEVCESGTQFALWAPSARTVTLRLFTCGSSEQSDDMLIETVTMAKQSDGAWTANLPRNLDGVYYDYLLEFDGGVTHRSADPWARAAGINGRRSMVVDLARTDPEGWDEDERPRTPTSETMVWEAHVGSFSNNPHSGVPKEHRGKYLAFTDMDTTLDGDGEHPTCMNYLRDLGVTAVQLLPFYDYGSVDERDPSQFNWGYDPLNYNVPEGSFSTDPYDGANRITECKRMIQSLHANGIKVIMDVVYNHMYSADNWFERTVPGYYLRRNDDGTLANGSGCGDDMQTERSMFRRFIVESVTYWAREYHLDGFRFDLMGLIDVQTMNAVRASLDRLPGGESILMYGEPWAAGPTNTLPDTELADKEGLRYLSTRIGHFCDRTRDAIKGHVFYMERKGYVNGDARANKPLIELGADAWRAPETNEGEAGQIIQYVSAHDDLTLWDKLTMSMFEGAERLEAIFDAEPCPQTTAVLEANKLAAGIIYTAAGIPFMLAGEEFGKTKHGNDNSFDSGKEVNEVDWRRAWHMGELRDYYRRLIALRRANPDWFDAEHIAVDAPGNAVAYRMHDTAVTINPDGDDHTLAADKLTHAYADDAHDDLPMVAGADGDAAPPRWVCVLDSTTQDGMPDPRRTESVDGHMPMPARSLRVWRLEPDGVTR